MNHNSNLQTWLFPGKLYGYKIVRFALLLILVAAFSVRGYSQVFYPPGDAPIDRTEPYIATDTFFSDSVSKIWSINNVPFPYNPNAIVLQSKYSAEEQVEGAVDKIWGEHRYMGTTFNINVRSTDPDYFGTFPAGTQLFRMAYGLKVYAPGDVKLQTPIYQQDSLYIEMSTESPEVGYKIDLSNALVKYVPPSGWLTVDSTDTTGFVSGLIDSVSGAYADGRDSIHLGEAYISLDSALHLADSAALAFRGVTSGAAFRMGAYATVVLTFYPSTIYTYPSFDPAWLHIGLSTGTHVVAWPSGGGVVSSGGGIGGGVVVSGGVVGAGGGVIILPPWPWPWGGSPCTTPVTANGVVPGNPVTYKWIGCPHPNYQIQILRLYNIDPTLTSDEHYIKAKIDWSQALDLETNNGQQSIKLTTAEGTGYYVWRVRYIEDAFANTIGDDRNWGPWSSTAGTTFDNGNTVSITPSSLSAWGNFLFFYNEFDDSLNWIYNRQFVEGEINHGSQLRIGEKNTYANYLLMPVQEQVKAQTADSILASQIVLDHAGRPSLQTMAAPIGQTGFNYEYDYIKNTSGALYNANDYDNQSNYLTPQKVSGASKLAKYYSNLNGDIQIPNCDSLPYTRTLYYNDALGRPREIASPGKYHNFGSNHTVKKYYGSPATTELIRIFGDEAPKSSSVLKTYTIDPNNVFNVTYTDRVTNKVLATCLSAPQSELLDTVPSHTFTVYDTVDDKVPGYVPSRLLETKTYTFAIPTRMDYLYNILPNVYGDSCLGLCGTCDYIINITASNIDDTDVTHQYHYQIVVSPGVDSTGFPCIGSWVGHGDVYSVNGSIILDPGTYVVTACVLLGNNDPMTGVPYITEMDSTLRRKVKAQMWFSPGSVIGGSSPVTLATIKTYLDAGDMNGLLTYTGADMSQPYFYLVVGCDTLQLPTDHCAPHDCSVIDFAEHFVTEMTTYDATNGTSYFSGVSDISATTDANNLFLINSNSDFNAVIGRMISDGYNCDSLWNAWLQTEQWFISTQISITTGTMTSSTPKADWWQEFMNRVGYKFPFMPYQPASHLGNPSYPLYKFPYKLFPYDYGTRPTAEDLFCYMYEAGTGLYTGGTFTCSSSSTTTGWWAHVENFPAHPASDSFHMYNFYQLVKPSSPAYTTLIVGSGSGGLGFPGTTGSSYAIMEHECYTLCDSRYNALADEIAQEFMNNGYQVDGYPYLTWYTPQPAYDTVDLPKVYCMASALVSTCKAGCKLTPDPVTGIVPPSQIQAYQKSMTWSMAIEVSLADSPTCHDKIINHDTTFVLWIDKDSCAFIPALGQDSCFHVSYSKDTGYTLYTTTDTGYHPVYNTDSAFSKNQALLEWLDHQYKHLYDSLRAVGFASVYNWQPFESAGASSFGSAPFCAGHIIPIDPNQPIGIFSYDTVFTAHSSCTGFDVYRKAPKTAFIHSNMEMEVDVVLGSALAAGDSIVVVEPVPTGATYVSSNGVLAAGTVIHFSSVGPVAAGDTLKLKWVLQMPFPDGTPVNFNGQVLTYSGSSVTSTCSINPWTSTADSCIDLDFAGMTLDGTWIPYTPLCPICYQPMGCGAGICMHYEQPKPDHADSLYIMTCAQFVCNAFKTSLYQQIQSISDHHSDKLRHAYKVQCYDPEKIIDNYVNTFQLNQYQYTLYYYDRAGNLVRTVQPRGVRDTGTGRYDEPPRHYDITKYEYNTLTLLTKQTSPDVGSTTFEHDRRGKIRLSQNAEQGTRLAYSYTKYDALARVIEAGEISSYPAIDTVDVNNPNFPVTGGAYPKSFITQTVYSQPFTTALPGYGVFTGSNLQNRISYVITDRDGNFATTADEIASIYSYDMHGNVASLVQWPRSAASAVVLNYQYDLLSNKVVKVNQYKLGTVKDDYLEQWYSYDGDKRLTNVQSTYAPGGAWSPEAAYSYYLHGPMRRVVMGGNRQGLDYTYTLQGWLKGINYSWLGATRDPGHDGPSVSTGKDVYGEVLNYYKGDFNRTGSIFNSISNTLNLTVASPTTYGGGDLFNGNITSWMYQTDESIWGVSTTIPQLYNQSVAYSERYDQLNRITKNRFWQWTGSVWTRTHGDPFDEWFSYDENGNIKTLMRNAQDAYSGAALTTDNMTYTYYTDGSGNNINRLSTVTDPVGNAGYGDMPSSTAYQYDGVGNLSQRADATTTVRVRWTPYGKIDSTISYSGGSMTTGHAYLYDGTGNQVSDQEFSSGGLASRYYHIYDGNNTEMAKYRYQASGLPAWSNTMVIQDRYIYGSDRLAIMKGHNVVTGFGWWWWSFYHVWAPSFDKYYEVKDHLGNVRAIVDNIAPAAGTGQMHVYDHYNYYAFGSTHPYRTWDAWDMPFGFNDKQKKFDFGSTDYDFGARFYEARIGRWMSVDPLAEKFPWQTPYSGMDNSPIWKNDPTGMAPSTHTDEQGNVIDVYEDGNLGVYKHSNADIANGNLKNDQSKLVGVTLYEKSFRKGDKIDFGSYRAMYWINSFESNQEAIVGLQPIGFIRKGMYAIWARNGQAFDPKSFLEGGVGGGSQLSEGVYISNRDLGNYAAGAFARINGYDKQSYLAETGAFQISKNNLSKFLWNHGTYIKKAYAHTPTDGAFQRTYGEDDRSNYFIRLGYEKIRTLQQFNSKFSTIFFDDNRNYKTSR